MKNTNYFVYILTNKTNGVFYTGSSSKLIRRTKEHKRGSGGFTEKYQVDKLVYFERVANKEEALKRERNIKKWKRSWKVDLIEKNNPRWKDLFEEI